MLSSSALGLSALCPSSDAAPNGGVNQILHALRGEHFRRALNADRVRLARAAPSQRNAPTVPAFSDPSPPPSHFLPVPKPTPGPAAPRSWTQTARQQERDRADSAAWRASALELCFAPPRRDSLSQMCLEIILAQEPDVVLEILPELPVHLRRQVMHHTAVHGPLSADGLRALLSSDPKCGVGSELVLGRSYGAGFLQRAGVLGDSSTTTAEEAPSRDWDADDEPTFATDAEESRPLDTLVLLTCPLSPATLSLLPSTLTRLALLALPVPLTGLQRLPGLLPLITFLDLSFNPSLLVPLDGRGRAIDRVQWDRWRRLEVLGLRQCGVDEAAAAELETKVQQGRMRDVVIYF